MSGAAVRVDAAGGLYVANEVQSGLGRTGAYFWGLRRMASRRKSL